MTDLTTVFISYAHDDELEARNLYKRLVNAGFDPWLDKEKLIPGEEWDTAIRRAIKNSGFVVLCLSDISVVKRGYLQKEFKLALDMRQEMLANDIYLLPVRLDKCDVPEELAHLQWVDYYEADGWQKILNALMSGKKRRMSADAAKAPNVSEPGPANQDRVEPAGADSAESAKRARVTEFGSVVPALPDGITRSGRAHALFASQQSMSPWLFFLIGALLVISGNVLLAATESESALKFVLATRGFSGLTFVHDNFWFLTLLGLSAGFLFIAGWLFSLFYRQMPRKSLKVLTSVALIAAVLSVGNVAHGFSSGGKFLPVATNAIIDRLPSRFASLTPLQESSGGLRGVFSPQEHADIWSSGQLLTAVLSDASHRAERAFRPGQIWNALDYFETVRSTQAGGGWGHSPSYPTTEITAWVTVAEAAALKRKPAKLFTEEQYQKLADRVTRDAETLIQRQKPVGGWGPLSESVETRTYSTVMAIWALLEASEVVELPASGKALDAANRGAQWLFDKYDPVHGWSPNPKPGREGESFPGLTAQVLFVLTKAAAKDGFQFVGENRAYRAGVDRVLTTDVDPRQPINALDSRIPDGDVHFGDSEFIMEGSTFLSFPWTVALLHGLAYSDQIPEAERSRARERLVEMLLRWEALEKHLDGAIYAYIWAENLYAVSSAVAYHD